MNHHRAWVNTEHNATYTSFFPFHSVPYAHRSVPQRPIQIVLLFLLPVFCCCFFSCCIFSNLQQNVCRNTHWCLQKVFVILGFMTLMVLSCHTWHKVPMITLAIRITMLKRIEFVPPKLCIVMRFMCTRCFLLLRLIPFLYSLSHTKHILFTHKFYKI